MSSVAPLAVVLLLAFAGCIVPVDNDPVRSSISPTTISASTAPGRPMLLADWKFDDAQDDGNRIRDTTKNGFYVWEGGDPQKATSTISKHGRGIAFDGIDDSLSSSDTRLALSGDMTVRIVFERSGTNRGDELFGHSLLGDEEHANALYSVFIRPSGVLHYDHESGDGMGVTTGSWASNNEERESAAIVSQGLHVLTMRRDVDEQRVLLELDGEPYINKTFERSPTGGERGFFQIGRCPACPGTPLKGAVYDFKIWNYWVPDSALDAL